MLLCWYSRYDGRDDREALRRKKSFALLCSLLFACTAAQLQQQLAGEVSVKAFAIQGDLRMTMPSARGSRTIFVVYNCCEGNSNNL